MNIGESNGKILIEDGCDFNYNKGSLRVAKYGIGSDPLILFYRKFTDELVHKDYYSEISGIASDDADEWITKWFELNKVPTFGAEYEAVLTQANVDGAGLPSLSTQIVDNQLCVDLVAGTCWDDIDHMKIQGTDASLEFAKYDWKNPTLSARKSIFVNNPTKDGFNGIYGNASTSYVNSKFNPALHKSAMTDTDAHMMIWLGDTANMRFGGQEGDFVQRAIGIIEAKYESGFCHSTIAAGQSFSEKDEMHIVNVINASGELYYRNANNTEKSVTGLTHTGLPDVEQCIGAMCTGVTPGSYTSGKCVAFTMGKNLRSKHTAFYNAFKTRRDAL